MKLEKLTPEQEAMLPKYREMGMKIGLATGPEMDEKEVRRLTDAHRELCGVPKATSFVVIDSPFARPDLTPATALYGQHDIHWLIFYMFFRVECGLIKETDKIVQLFELAKRVGWMWMTETETVVSRRPSKIHLLTKPDGLQVLHNTSGMALEYVDGKGLYSLNGLRIPKKYSKVFHHKEKVTAKEVFSIPNTEIRGAIIRMLGPDFMVNNMESKIRHEAEIRNGGYYKLMEVDVEGVTRVYLTGVCPSKGDRWYEAVPPETKTCQAALNWREWGELSDNYVIPEVRT